MEAKCCWVQTEAEDWSCTEFLQTLPVFSSVFPKTTPMRRCCECETLCKPLQNKGGKCFSSHVFGRHSFGILKKQIKRLKLGRATWVGLEEGGHRRSVGRVGDDAVAEQEPERTARHFVEQVVGAFGWG